MPEIEQQSNNAAAALLFGKYEVGKLLGCGAFAKVFHAREASTGRSVALKVISKKKLLSSNASLANNVKREVSIMKRLRHRNIVALHEVAATKSKIYFAMDFVKGGELFAKVAKGRFSEDLARRYFRQLVSAVGYCHSRGVFHRDLKPENLLIDDRGNLKVSDFGLSAVAVDQTRCDGLLHTLCGTPAYVAPEILAKKGYDGARVDVWSCGVVLFVLTAGYLPFNDPNLMAMYKKIYKGEYRCPKWMSPELKRFLSRLLETNPAQRITVDEIVNDPWFSHGGFDAAKEFYCEEEEKEEDDAAVVTAEEEEEENNGSLNAFHIISFSSGLDLSGLFSGNPAEDGERFLSREEPGAVVERIEGFAREEGVRVKRRKGMGVEMEGLNGNFSARVEFYRVNEELVVVEAKRKGGDSGVYKAMWRTKLRSVLEGDSGEVSDYSTSSSSDL